MDAAEELAGNDSDAWVRIATIWKRDFKDSESLFRCLDKAGWELDNWWDNYDFVSIALEDLATRDRGGVADLGHFSLSDGPSHVARMGTWGSDCISERRPGSFTKYYNFRLVWAGEVSILLESGEDACLYLTSNVSGKLLEEDTDTGYLSVIKCSLGAGTYAIEAAAYYEAESGLFSLNVFYDPS